MYQDISDTHSVLGRGPRDLKRSIVNETRASNQRNSQTKQSPGTLEEFNTVASTSEPDVVRSVVKPSRNPSRSATDPRGLSGCKVPWKRDLRRPKC